MRFIKVEGAGNDYVLVDGFEEVCDDPARWSRRLADRHLGVGSDGLLLVEPPSSGSEAVARMRIFNADGSEGLMCGNGLRCVVRWLVRIGRAEANGVVVETASGLRRGRLLSDVGAGRVEVDMGEVSFVPERIPTRLAGDGRVPPRLELDAGGATLCGHAVSVGNPHLVLLAPDDLPLQPLGPRLECHAAFPEGVNVHLVSRTRPDGLTARTWERGSGATRACGTGAVACAAVARELGWCDAASIEVAMPGGSLGVRLEDEGRAFLTGPARIVFSGKWDAP